MRGDGQTTRGIFFFVILGSLFVLFPITATGYQWPVSLFSSQHKIVGTLGETRVDHLHAGVDISEPWNTNVYTVFTMSSGTVYAAEPNGISSFVRVRHYIDLYAYVEFDYVHIDPLVNVGDVVYAGVTVLGDK